MSHPTIRTAAVGVAVLFVAIGAMAGIAAADDSDEITIETGIGVEANDEGGQGGFTCVGMPTDHDCDKGGEIDAGPISVDYAGFNGGNLEDGTYAFGDTFVVTVDDRLVVAAFECELDTEPEPENLCPVEFSDEEPADDGSPGNSGGNGENSGQGNDNAPDHANND